MAEDGREGAAGLSRHLHSESSASMLATSSAPSDIDVEVSSCTFGMRAAGQSSSETRSCKRFDRRTLGLRFASAFGAEEDNASCVRRRRGSRSGGVSLRRHRIRVTGRRNSLTLSGVSGCQRGLAEAGVEFESSSGEDRGAIEMLGLPLGMSMAVVFAKVLDGTNATGERISADHLSKLCSGAIKESLFYVFGNHFNSFIRNFEKSFGSTLQTLHLVNEAPLHQQKMACSSSSEKDGEPGVSPVRVAGNSSSLADETLRITSRINNQPASTAEEAQEHGPVLVTGSSVVTRLIQENACPIVQASSTVSEENQDILGNFMNRQVVIHGQVDQQLTCISPDTCDFRFKQSFLGTFERSVREQERSNDLKTYEIGLTMKQLHLKEKELMIDCDANFLERLKLSFGFSKASFKKEKLENEMKNAAYSELVKNCADGLLGGLIVMLAFVGYATYVHSYDIFIEASAACTQSSKGWRNWWIPTTVSSLGAPLIQLTCYIGILSRMFLSLCFFAAVAYFLLRQSSSSGQSSRITFILIILGVGGSISGKLCVDGLGGSGNCWVCYWCILCSLHAIANIFTPALYYVLNGPLAMSRGAEKVWTPYWVRRFIFYSCIFMILPMLCGLMPFASIHDWGQHFFSLGARV